MYNTFSYILFADNPPAITEIPEEYTKKLSIQMLRFIRNKLFKILEAKIYG